MEFLVLLKLTYFLFQIIDKKINNKEPVYMTRQMEREFKRVYGRIPKIPFVDRISGPNSDYVEFIPRGA